MIKNRLKKILVIKHGSLGDIVFSLQAMYSIRMHFQSSKIYLLTESKFEKFIINSKYFDDIIFDNREGLLNSSRILKILLKKNFDLVIDLQNSKRSNFYNFFLRYFSKSIINGNRFNSTFRYIIKKKGSESPINGLNNQIKLLGIKIISDDYKWLQINTDIKDHQNLILVIPSVSKSGKNKQWPKKNFVDLCLRLEKYGNLICLVGTKNDRNVTDYIVKECNNVLNLTEKSPPEIIFSIALKSKLIITNDTGPGHVAALSKKKTIWLAVDNITTNINIDNNQLNQKILSNKIENITVDSVFNKIKENL